jgi:hypothetical protein
MTKLEKMRELAAKHGGKALDFDDVEWEFESSAKALDWANDCDDAGLHPGVDYGFADNVGISIQATRQEEL